MFLKNTTPLQLSDAEKNSGGVGKQEHLHKRASKEHVRILKVQLVDEEEGRRLTRCRKIRVPLRSRRSARIGTPIQCQSPPDCGVDT